MSTPPMFLVIKFADEFVGPRRFSGVSKWKVDEIKISNAFGGIDFDQFA